jgi:hypothetical protein
MKTELSTHRQKELNAFLQTRSNEEEDVEHLIGSKNSAIFNSDEVGISHKYLAPRDIGMGRSYLVQGRLESALILIFDTSTATSFGQATFRMGRDSSRLCELCITSNAMKRPIISLNTSDF